MIVKLSPLDVETKELINTMFSDDFRERFQAEYYQTAIRFNKLVNMLVKWDKCELSFEPKSPRSTFIDQLDGMSIYLSALADRANYEGIEIAPLDTILDKRYQDYSRL